MEKHLEQLLDSTLALLLGLTPAALGALVSLAYEKGLTWTDRFVQFSVGVCVSWFASRALGAMVTLDPFVLQGVTFTLGMIAFKSVPKFASSCSDILVGLPADLRARFFPPKKDGQ